MKMQNELKQEMDEFIGGLNEDHKELLEDYTHPNQTVEELKTILQKIKDLDAEGLDIDSNEYSKFGARSLSDIGHVHTSITKAIISGRLDNEEGEILEFLRKEFPYKTVIIERVELDETEEDSPALILSNGAGYLLNFRNYYWTISPDFSRDSNSTQVEIKNTNRFDNPTKLVSHILKGKNIEKIDFTEREVVLINEWIKQTERFYMEPSGKYFGKSNTELGWE